MKRQNLWACGYDNFTLYRNDNGNLVFASHEPQAMSYKYNCDNKLRSATKGTEGISVKYDPMGNRIVRNTGTATHRKYVVDISGDLPTILVEIDADTGSLKRTYIYANSEILCQHNGDYTAARYYYLHDRLGSVRMMINSDGAVTNHYTYDPWGLVPTGESYEDVNNLYRFANYAYDSETNLYYCINRIYDPVLWRFTSKDPVQGTYENPMTLHRYLYVTNNPINDKDPTGKMGLWGALRAAERTVEAVDAYYGALDFGLTNTGNPAGMLDWLPELNAQRELLFSERRINRPYNWEAYLGPNMEGFLWKVIGTASNGLLQGMENIYNLCDWPKLSGCILTEISQHQQEFSICAGFFLFMSL
jgi:RHS repeat-associated protein